MNTPPAAEQLLLEALSDHAGHYQCGGRLIDSGHTAIQRYEVWDSPQFGRLLRLDDFFMTSERDEFFYHENLIHVPAICQKAPQRALIIGGGDGGSAEELFKYSSSEEVVLVEIDAKVVEIARQHLAGIHKGAFDNPRLSLRIGDGQRYVREVAPAERKTFDLIVLDLTDPVGPAAALYAEDFFGDCKALLSAQGALTLHLGAPIYQPERVQEMIQRLRRVFTRVRPHFHYIPLYGSLWGMASASDTVDPAEFSAAEIDRRIRDASLVDLQYFNGAVHAASFAYPNYLRALVGE